MTGFLFKAPLCASVVAITASLTAAKPLFLIIKFFNNLNATAGSVVVPDFDITLTANFLFSS